MLALIAKTPVTDNAHSPDLRSAQVFSFITPGEPGTQHGLRLYDPESESPITFRKGDPVDLNGHTDEEGIFHLASYHRLRHSPGRSIHPSGNSSRTSSKLPPPSTPSLPPTTAIPAVDSPSGKVPGPTSSPSTAETCTALCTATS